MNAFPVHLLHGCVEKKVPIGGMESPQKGADHFSGLICLILIHRSGPKNDLPQVVLVFYRKNGQEADHEQIFVNFVPTPFLEFRNSSGTSKFPYCLQNRRFSHFSSPSENKRY